MSIATREAVTTLLAEHGLEGNYDIHSWRCQHPDRYGPCDCVSELVDNLMVLVTAGLAAAWDEGVQAQQTFDAAWDAEQESADAPKAEWLGNPYTGANALILRKETP